ncbi:hypothetical protein QE357_000362 [Siphonobacter sp. BAB-5404]|nr:hypothetical protein [Siphonobacter sp. SORGH_AS_0500]
MALLDLRAPLTGKRLYLNVNERKRFLETTRLQEPNINYFCKILCK